MIIDHEAAKKWAEKIVAIDEIRAQQPELVNLSACYLDAMTRLDKATELLRQIERWERMFDDPDAQTTCAIIRAFLDERSSTCTQRRKGLG